MSSGDKAFNLVLWIVLAVAIVLPIFGASWAWLLLGFPSLFLLGARNVDGPGARFW